MENNRIVDYMAFADVWRVEQNKIIDVQLFYMDAEKLYTYLN
jgi:hypothetical protein